MSTKFKSRTTTPTSTATVGGAEGSTSGGGNSTGGASFRAGVERTVSAGSSARGSAKSERSNRAPSDVEHARKVRKRGSESDDRERGGSFSKGRMEEEERDREDTPLPEGLEGEDILKPRLSQAKRQWSIQAVKGKVTTRCLWNACKALTIGTILIFIGAGLATIGYYAEEENLRRLQNMTEGEVDSGVNVAVVNHVSNHTSPYWRPPQIIGSNTPRRGPRPPSTYGIDNGPVLIANSSTGGPKATASFASSSAFGLNKLSYVGPIVMGIGGFVIVAACVMTFEARDSAAKIVPARFRKTFPERPMNRLDEPNVRHSSAQTKWETLGLYGTDLVRLHHEKDLSRRAMTSAFIRFSKTIQSSMDSSTEYYEFRGGHRGSLVKCPSAPSLIREFHQSERRSMEAPRILRVSAFPRPPPRRRLSSNIYPRQTMSVDSPAVKEVYTASYPQFIGERGDEDMELGASATGVHQVGSDASLALDLHLPRCAVTLAVRDSSRSPSGHTELDEASVVTPVSPLPEQPLSSSLPTEEIAGPSGFHTLQVTQSRPKVDKQTSTSDNNNLALLGWSRDTWESREASTQLSSRAVAGGSFREPKRPKAGKKVKRSETIDTATSAHRKSHRKAHHQQRNRSGSVSKSTNNDHKLIPVRSETARRHQLLRQPKIENPETHDDVDKTAEVV